MQQLTGDEWAELLADSPERVIELADVAVVIRDMHGVADDDVMISVQPVRQGRRRVFVMSATLAFEFGQSLSTVGARLLGMNGEDSR